MCRERGESAPHGPPRPPTAPPSSPAVTKLGFWGIAGVQVTDSSMNIVVAAMYMAGVASTTREAALVKAERYLTEVLGKTTAARQRLALAMVARELTRGTAGSRHFPYEVFGWRLKNAVRWALPPSAMTLPLADGTTLHAPLPLAHCHECSVVLPSSQRPRGHHRR